MKTIDQYNIDEFEEQFLQLAHLDDLEIYFEFFLYFDYLIYCYKDECLFLYNKKDVTFWINKPMFINMMPYFNEIERNHILKKMINKHFNIYDFALQFFNDSNGVKLNKKKILT